MQVYDHQFEDYDGLVSILLKKRDGRRSCCNSSEIGGCRLSTIELLLEAL